MSVGPGCMQRIELLRALFQDFAVMAFGQCLDKQNRQHRNHTRRMGDSVLSAPSEGRGGADYRKLSGSGDDDSGSLVAPLTRTTGPRSVTALKIEAAVQLRTVPPASCWIRRTFYTSSLGSSRVSTCTFELTHRSSRQKRDAGYNSNDAQLPAKNIESYGNTQLDQPAVEHDLWEDLHGSRYNHTVTAYGTVSVMRSLTGLGVI
ncbi:hypothetical protein HPB50_020297 [Hyalomma asiaticum]|uniref:Uncharacterized protein n=1 Tax=Hyalomma asiaticum TaxID=266040 RepID=A0ACB7T0Z0_HYAAI|nr:hypothetical protein HPB50_020297 [Hyalomma asiaticum]